MRRKTLFPALFAVLGLLLFLPALALAAGAPNPDTHLVLSTDQLWAAVAAYFTPLAVYMLNHFAPWTSEPVKGIVQGVAAIVAAAVAQAIVAGDVGFNATTLQFIVTGGLAALLGHKTWVVAGINAVLGGGSNAPARGRIAVVESGKE